MKIFTNLALLLLLVCFGGVQAQEQHRTHTEFEIPKLSIKLSQDRTGIIKNVTCGGCDYNFVTITPSTVVYVNGKEVDLLRANERIGKPVFITFYRDKGEVRSIHWSE